MKKLFLIVSLLIGLVASAQYPPKYTGVNARYDWISGRFRSGLHLPSGCGYPSLFTDQWVGDGAIYLDSCNNKLYWYRNSAWWRVADTSYATPGGGGNDSLGWVKAEAFGARGDGVRLTDGAITNADATFTSASASFSASDVGKSIVVGGAGGSGTDLRTTIASINSSTSVELTANASATVSSAVTKYGTNNTPTIQAALNYAATRRAATVYVKTGVYYIFDSLRTLSVAGNPNSQLYIPLSPYSGTTDTLKTIEILGEVPPNYFSDPTANKASPKTGVIIESTLRHSGSILGSASETVSWGDFNFVQLSIKNLAFRVSVDSSTATQVGAKSTAIDGSKLAMLGVENVRCDLSKNIYTSLAPQTTAYGIKTPAINNFCLSLLNKIVVTGFYTGVTMNEHTNIIEGLIDACENGIDYLTASHGSNINKIIIARCINAVKVSGAHNFVINNLVVETKTDAINPVSAWFTSVNTLKEDVSGSFGFIRYAITNSGGAGGAGGGTFVRTNGTSSKIIAVRYDQVLPRWTTSTRPAGVDGVKGFNTTIGLYEYYTNSNWVGYGLAWSGSGDIQYASVSGASAVPGGSANLNWSGNILKVQPNADNQNTIRINAATTGNAALQLGTYPSFPSYGGFWGGNITPSGSNYAFISDGSTEAIFNNPTSLKFRINHGSAPNAMVITSTGVGVKNNSPSEALDVTGNVRFSGALMPNNTAGTSGQVLTSAGAGSPPTWGNTLQSKAITIESPTSSENITMFYTDKAITITKAAYVVTGSSSPSVTIDVHHHTDRSSGSPNELFGTNVAVTSTTGTTNTSFNDATIPAGSWVWIISSAQSGTVTSLNVTLTYTVD